jgi:hypothetical protein
LLPSCLPHTGGTGDSRLALRTIVILDTSDRRRIRSRRGEDHMRYLIAIGVLCGAIALLAQPVLAAPPDNPNCWGQASSEFAQSEPGALGEHASSPPPLDLTPDRPGRAGIGNVARILGGDHPSDAAAALGADCS